MAREEAFALKYGFYKSEIADEVVKHANDTSIDSTWKLLENLEA